MDWLLLGVLTIAVLTGAALVLLLIEPDVRGRASPDAAREPPPRSSVPPQSPHEPELTGQERAGHDRGAR